MKHSRTYLGLSIGVLLCASQAFAAPSRADRRQASKLFREANELVKQGEFAEAADAYQLADELNPAPSYKLGHAKMLSEVGQLLEAAEVLEACVETKPRQWGEKQARRKCEAMIEEVAERTPTLEVEVLSPADEVVFVTVDDEEFDPDAGAVSFNPGDHAVEARADGHRLWRKRVELSEGDAATVEISLRPASVEPEPVEQQEDGGGISPVPAYLFWGAGVVGIGLGVGFGIAAIDATQVVRTDYGCDGNDCPARAADDIRVAQTDGDISTASFVVGGAAAAVGTVLWLFTGDEDDEAEDDVARADATPVLAPTFFGVKGTF